jgi:hypothetical protein
MGRSSKGILGDYLQALPALAQPQEQRTSRCHKQLRPHLRSSLRQARSAHLRPVLPLEPRPRRHLGQSRHPALPQPSPGLLVSACTRNNLRSRRTNLEQLNGCPRRRDARQLFVPRVWHLHRQRSYRLHAGQSRRGPGCPAYATMPWTTPTTPGHYCIQVQLEPYADVNFENNLGQENTNVGTATSPAVFTFPLRNGTRRTQTYNFEVDAYIPLTPDPCGTGPNDAKARVARLAKSRRGLFPVPAGWQLTITPNAPAILPNQSVPISLGRSMVPANFDSCLRRSMDRRLLLLVPPSTSHLPSFTCKLDRLRRQ